MSDERLLEDLLEALRDATWLVRGLVASEMRVWQKGHDEPVTEVDLQVERFLRRRLLELCPDHGWLSEESPDNRKRLGRRRTWIVDPIDGTRQLIEGRPEYAISVALEQGGGLVLGALAFPGSGDVYAALKGAGATRNGVRLRVAEGDDPRQGRVLVSRRQLDRGDFASLPEDVPLLAAGGAAYKIARVADGHAIGCFTAETRHEWDVAAASLILREAGGRISDALGAPLTFNTSHARVAGIVASNGAAHATLLGWARAGLGGASS